MRGKHMVLTMNKVRKSQIDDLSKKLADNTIYNVVITADEEKDPQAVADALSRLKGFMRTNGANESIAL